eukprot:3862059-Amphidinium_carterae.7
MSGEHQGSTTTPPTQTRTAKMWAVEESTGQGITDGIAQTIELQDMATTSAVDGLQGSFALSDTGASHNLLDLECLSDCQAEKAERSHVRQATGEPRRTLLPEGHGIMPYFKMQDMQHMLQAFASCIGKTAWKKGEP